jgi:hypothetical protein
MTKSKNLGLNLPSRDNTTDLADINVISDNFETVDNEFEEVYNKLNNTVVINTVSGNTVVLKDSANAPLHNLKLFGKTEQSGTQITSVGDSGSFTVKIQGENVEEQTLTIIDTLRSVPNTTVKDVKDFTIGETTKKIHQFTFNGSEEWEAISNGRVAITVDSKYSPNVDLNGLYAPAKAICNRLQVVSWASLATSENAVAFGNASIIGFKISGHTDSVDAWKSYLSSNPVTVVYELKNPIETPLAETELNAYRQLHTNKPATTILSEADMEVSYVADTKLYIDNKIAELTALTLEG